MQEPALPSNELERLQAFYRYDVLDTPAEEVFDRITRVASALAKVPICLISLIDGDRQWFKSKVGLDVRETPRNISFCGLRCWKRAVLSSRMRPRIPALPTIRG